MIEPTIENEVRVVDTLVDGMYLITVITTVKVNGQTVNVGFQSAYYSCSDSRVHAYAANR